MSVDPRRSGVLCGSNPRCYRECRCSRWPDYRNRFGNLVNAGQEYYEKVLSYSPIAYWPLWETSGTVAQDLVANVRAPNPNSMDGTYSSGVAGWPVGAGIGDGYTAPQFDGANDYVNVYSATFAGRWNGNEGSLLIWSRVTNVGVWTDAAIRYFCRFFVNAANEVRIWKHSLNNRFVYNYVAGGVTETITKLGMTETGWMQVGLTWSASAGVNGEVKAYYNGVQEGATQTALGVWAGALLNTNVVIGSQAVPVGSPWSGWEAHCAVWDRPLSQPEIADMYVVP